MLKHAANVMLMNADGDGQGSGKSATLTSWSTYSGAKPRSTGNAVTAVLNSTM